LAGGVNSTWPVRFDLTDQNGNGILIATDQIFVVMAHLGAAVNAQATAKVTYRIVNVGIQEYVGIVQSQTSV